MDMQLKEKISIITGSGRGIGKEIAQKFAKEDSTVILAAKSKKEIDQTLKEIENNGGKGISFPTDISKLDEVTILVKKVIQKFSKVDILINNAGIVTPIGSIQTNDPIEWENTIKTNLLGTYYCVYNVLPYMIKQNYGKIINLSGGGAFHPFPYFSAYSSSKAAIIRLTETLAKELEDYNISINAISPGAIKTKITEQIIKNGDKAGNELLKAQEVMENGGANIQNVLNLALFLGSEKSNGLSGKTISAQWDDLQYIKNNISEIQNSDKYTMRRIT